MRTDNANKSSNTAQTSTTEPTADEPKAGESEAAYVARQADEARRAIGEVFGQIKRQLAAGADPRQWAKAHPWWSLAGAVAAGFVAAAGAVPSKEDQALKRLTKLERALNPPKAARFDDGTHDDPDGHEKRGGGFLAALSRELIGAVKPVLLSTLTAGISAKVARPSADDLRGAAEGASDQDGSDAPSI